MTHTVPQPLPYNLTFPTWHPAPLQVSIIWISQPAFLGICSLIFSKMQLKMNMFRIILTIDMRLVKPCAHRSMSASSAWQLALFLKTDTLFLTTKFWRLLQQKRRLPFSQRREVEPSVLKNTRLIKRQPLLFCCQSELRKKSRRWRMTSWRLFIVLW